MGIWKIHRREIKKSNFSERAAQQLLENRSRRFLAVRSKDSTGGRFPNPRIHRRAGRERSRRGNAELQRESEIQLGSQVPKPEVGV